MKITAFDDLYPGLVASGGTTLVSSSGSNSGFTGGDVLGEPGDLSVVGLRRQVSLQSNLASGAGIGDVLTVVQVAGEVQARFAVPSNSGGASFGSNVNAVGFTNAVGASSNTTRADHVHMGVSTITSSSSNSFAGTINLRPGANITFALSDTDGNGALDTLTIAGAAGGGAGGGAPTAAKYVVAEAHADLSAEIIIPGLAGSPDVRVAATNDDEFDGDLTGWTQFGSPTTCDVNTTILSHLYLKKNAAAGANVAGIYKASPSTPFTMTAKLAGAGIGGNYNMAGIFVGVTNPASGAFKAAMFQVGGAASGQWNFGVLAWTNPTTYNGGGTYSGWQFPGYIRIVATSSTNVSFQYSPTGYFWYTLVASNNPGFTIGSVGLFVNPDAASADAYGAFDWVRFT